MLPLFALLHSPSAFADDPAPADKELPCWDEDRIVVRAAGQCLAPVAMVQLWGTVWDQDVSEQADASGYGDPEDDPGFKLKRLELGFEGMGKNVDYEVVLGTTAAYDGYAEAEEVAGIKYANVGWSPTRWFRLGAGRMKTPFSRDALMSSKQLTFQERGFVAEHVATPTTLGMTMDFEKWGARLTLGVFNSGNSLFGDEAPGKTFGGRLAYAAGQAPVYSTWGENRKEFGIGIGASGFYSMDVATNTLALGGDLMLRAAGLSLLADVGWSQISPGDTTVDASEVWTDTTRMALTTQLSYNVWKLEPAVRFTGMLDSSAGDYAQLMGGLVLHTWKDRARVGAGYVHRFEGETPGAVANDTLRAWAQVGI